MKINNDKNIIKELEITLKYYIKGIIVNCKSSNKWIEPIQRITENALIEYTIIDKKKRKFLELQQVIYKDNIINIIFNCEENRNNKIKIVIPYNNKIDSMYILEGCPKIII